MFRIERKILDSLSDNIDLIFIISISIFGLFIRLAIRGVISNDMSLYLIPWYDEFLKHGRIMSLSHQIGNYGVPYQTIIAILTYLPVSPVTAYKMVSWFFDYVLALGCALTVGELTRNKTYVLAVYAITLFAPVVYLNSAVWGQCDSIYTSFCVFCLYFFLKDQYKPAFVSYGIACAFKLQAVFLLPFLLAYYFIKKKFSILHFLIIPLVMEIMSLGGILQGRSILCAFDIYLDQAKTNNNCLTMNYPNIWTLFSSKVNRRLAVYIAPAVTIAIAFAGIFLYYIIKNKIELKGINIILVSFLSVYICVYFLPIMHERYGYLYEILAIIILFVDFDTIFGVTALQLIPFMSYSRYLFKTTNYSLKMLAGMNALVLTFYIWKIIKEMNNQFS